MSDAALAAAAELDAGHVSCSGLGVPPAAPVPAANVSYDAPRVASSATPSFGSSEGSPEPRAAGTRASARAERRAQRRGTLGGTPQRASVASVSEDRV